MSLVVKAAWVDEFEALDAPQAMGALLNLPHCAMLIFSGDPFQRFHESKSRFVHAPWTDQVLWVEPPRLTARARFTRKRGH